MEFRRIAAIELFDRADHRNRACDPLSKIRKQFPHISCPASVLRQTNARTSQVVLLCFLLPQRAAAAFFRDRTPFFWAHLRPAGGNGPFHRRANSSGFSMFTLMKSVTN